MPIHIEPALCHVRTPLLPLRPQAGGAEVPTSVPMESLYLASHELYEQLVKQRLLEPGKAAPDQSLALTLEKYHRRMTYRCTPFGIFAGTSMASLATHTTFELEARQGYHRHVRLSMDYVCSLAQVLLQQPALRQALRFYPNNTLYQVGELFRYIEYTTGRKLRTHQLVQVDANDYVTQLLAAARDGAKLADLVRLLTDEDIATEEAEEFINELIDSQLLQSELEPNVTGPEYWQVLLTRLQQLPPPAVDAELLQHLLAIDQLLQEASRPAAELPVAHYARIRAHVQALPVAPDLKHLFQVDLVKPALAGGIHDGVAAEMQQAIDLLARVNPIEENETLRQFKDAFYQRYEDREISLQEALDFDLGIGYPFNQGMKADPAPLLNELAMRGGGALEEPATTPWQQHLLDRYTQAVRQSETSIELTAAEVAPYLRHELTLPTSFSASCSVLASSAAAIDQGHFQVQFNGASGPSAANIIGRFCHADAQLTHQVQQLLAREEAEQPEAVYAEIAYLPQSRIGNISLRPALRQYEIAIGLPAGVDAAHTLTLDDLTLRIHRNRLVLRSRRLNREVIPRLSTAHNYSLNALPVYHFLCDLQSQGSRKTIGLDWGPLHSARFLPRLSYGKTILNRARWYLFAQEISSYQALPAYLAAQQVPRFVVLTEHDNLLPLDLEEEMSRQLLWQALGKQKSVKLQEDLLQEATLWLPGPEGKFAHELVLAFRYTAEVPTPIAPPSSPATTVPRYFAPGSEWLYAKIYCGVQTADKLLVECLHSLAGSLLAEGSISKWFFIRYADPLPHLRVRFLGEPAAALAGLHTALQPYLASGLVHSFKLDTYERELDRYGATNIENSETLFYHDSEAAVAILALLEGASGDDLRWQLAIKGVDTLLTDLQFSLAEKRELLEQLSRGFLAETQGSMRAPKDFLKYKYRQHRGAIAALLTTPDAYLEPALHQFALRSEHLRTCAEHVLANNLDKYDLASSYVHMFLNRFLRSRQRLQEVVIYDMLHEHYKSVIARQRRQPAVV